MSHLVLPGLISGIARSYLWLFSKNVGSCGRQRRRGFGNSIGDGIRPWITTLHSIFALLITHKYTSITLTHMTCIDTLRARSSRNFTGVLRAKYRIYNIHIFVVLLESGWWLSSLVQEIRIEEINWLLMLKTCGLLRCPACQTCTRLIRWLLHLYLYLFLLV